MGRESALHKKGRRGKAFAQNAAARGCCTDRWEEGGALDVFDFDPVSKKNFPDRKKRKKRGETMILPSREPSMDFHMKFQRREERKNEISRADYERK